MVIFTYLSLCIFAIILALTDKNHSVFYYLSLMILFIWSIITRNFNIQADIVTYMEVMRFDIRYYMDFYYLREPIYWFSSKILYDVMGDSVIVFILLDFIIFSLFVFICYKTKIRPYFIILFMIFFPNLMGFLNVYRQFFATVFLFTSFLYIEYYPVRSKLLYLSAALSHNLAGIFLPIIFLKKKFIQPAFLITCTTSIPLMIFFSNTKSVETTGETSPFLFLIFILILLIFFLLANKLKINNENIKLVYLNGYCAAIGLFASVFLENAPAKRVSMVALVFLLYSVYWVIEKKSEHKSKLIYRTLFIIISLSPTFIFSSAFNMLLINN